MDGAKERGMDTLVGPKGLSPFDGYGILVEGFRTSPDDDDDEL